MLKRLLGLSLVFTVFGSSVFAYCFEQAGEYYGIDPALLYAIAYVESGMNPKAYRKNPNGTVDVGLMQINSVWWKELARWDIRPQHLWNPCMNIMVGTWILAQCVERYGYTWKAVDCYNKGPARAREHSPYTRKVWRLYAEIKSKGFSKVFTSYRKKEGKIGEFWVSGIAVAKPVKASADRSLEGAGFGETKSSF